MDVYTRFRARCVSVMEGTNFDSKSVLSTIDQMISQARAANAIFPELDLDKAAYTAVFNCVAQSLMCHNYNLSDRALSIEGELVLKDLRIMCNTMVELGYFSLAEMKDLISNLVDTTFFRT